VVVLLHQLLCRGETLGGRAGSCFGSHFQNKPFRGNQRVYCVDGGWRGLSVRGHCEDWGGFVREEKFCRVDVSEWRDQAVRAMGAGGRACDWGTGSGVGGP
jgi:hypothetical protein